MIRPSTLIGWINRYAGYPEENQLRSKSFKKCAVISEF